MTAYTLIRSRRKTLAIHITERAEVEVRAPLRLSRSVIDRFVAEKSGWIELHRAQMAARLEQRCTPAFDRLPYLGADYPVVRADGPARFDGSAFYLPREDTADTEALRTAAAGLYRSLAQKELPRRVARFAPLVGAVPSAVKVGCAARRWGSCSGAGSLNFTWRLMMADPQAVDYVVVHELAHLREHNHSPAFWRLVEDILPDYQARRASLQKLAERLWNEGW